MVVVFLEIFVFGEVMIEFNQLQLGCFEFLQGFGGDMLNFCIVVVCQGVLMGFVLVIGDDLFGCLFVDMWVLEQVDMMYV